MKAYPLFRHLALCLLLLAGFRGTGSAAAQNRATVDDGEPIRLGAETLTRSSEAVLLVRALRSESFWNEDRTAILTRITLRVDETLLGSSDAETEVIVPGGQVGNVIHQVSDMPVFTPGDEAVVFIERHAASGMNVVNGGAQGKLDVVTDRVTREKRVLGAEGLFSGDAEAAGGSAPGAQQAPAQTQGAMDSLAPQPEMGRAISLEAFKRALLGDAPNR